MGDFFGLTLISSSFSHEGAATMVMVNHWSVLEEVLRCLRTSLLAGEEEHCT